MVDRIPHDFLRFDPAELETPLRELLHATDQWAYVQEKEGNPWSSLDVETEEEIEIDRMLVDKGEAGNRADFLRERMMCQEGSLDARFDVALDELIEDGPSYMHQVDIAKDIVRRAGEKPRRATQNEERASYRGDRRYL